MSRRKLWTPFSTLLRRSIPSTCRRTSGIHLGVHTNLLEEPSLTFLCSSHINESSGIRFFSSSQSGAKCWNCNETSATTRPFLVCDRCKAVQPVDHSVDYFQIFSLGRNYEIEDGSLEGKYKDWQKKLHPDLVHSKSEKEREHAAEQSARVIGAYRTLQNPLSRAIYILKLEGLDIDEEQRITDPELLGEILEIREAVEEAADSEALKEIQTQMQQNLKHWSDTFAKAFENRQFEEAKIAIQRITYYERVKEEITKKL